MLSKLNPAPVGPYHHRERSSSAPSSFPEVTLQDVREAHRLCGLQALCENSRHSTWLPSPMNGLQQFEELADKSPRNMFSDWLNKLLDLNDQLVQASQLTEVEKRLAANELANRIEEVEKDYEAICGLN